MRSKKLIIILLLFCVAAVGCETTKKAYSPIKKADDWIKKILW